MYQLWLFDDNEPDPTDEYEDLLSMDNYKDISYRENQNRIKDLEEFLYEYRNYCDNHYGAMESNPENKSYEYIYRNLPRIRRYVIEANIPTRTKQGVIGIKMVSVDAINDWETVLSIDEAVDIHGIKSIGQQNTTVATLLKAIGVYQDSSSIVYWTQFIIPVKKPIQWFFKSLRYVLFFPFNGKKPPDDWAFKLLDVFFKLAGLGIAGIGLIFSLCGVLLTAKKYGYLDTFISFLK
jgi:hypothetical protein